VFVVEGERVMPTRLAAGPWSPDAQHGGAPAALLAWAVERAAAPLPMCVARLTVELMRPVPIRPLRLQTQVVRPGKKVQLVQASLFDGDTEVARGTALRLRTATVALPESARAPGTLLPAPQTCPPEPILGPEANPFLTIFELRAVHGSFATRGPATIWFRLRLPIIAGETPTPLMRVAAAADFGNGLSAVLEWTQWRFLNADLTIYLHRPPHGEWVALESKTIVEDAGVGLAVSQLHDERGPIGRSLQALLVEG